MISTGSILLETPDLILSVTVPAQALTHLVALPADVEVSRYLWSLSDSRTKQHVDPHWYWISQVQAQVQINVLSDDFPRGAQLSLEGYLTENNTVLSLDGLSGLVQDISVDRREWQDPLSGYTWTLYLWNHEEWEWVLQAADTYTLAVSASRLEASLVVSSTNIPCVRWLGQPTSSVVSAFNWKETLIAPRQLISRTQQGPQMEYCGIAQATLLTFTANPQPLNTFVISDGVPATVPATGLITCVDQSLFANGDRFFINYPAVSPLPFIFDFQINEDYIRYGASTATITCVPVAQLVNNDYFTIDDGLGQGGVYTFEFQVDESFSQVATYVIDVRGLTTAEEVASAIKGLLDGTVGGGLCNTQTSVDVVLLSAGSNYTGTGGDVIVLTENVGAPSFTVTSFGGGVDCSAALFTLDLRGLVSGADVAGYIRAGLENEPVVNFVSALETDQHVRLTAISAGTGGNDIHFTSAVGDPGFVVTGLSGGADGTGGVLETYTFREAASQPFDVQIDGGNFYETQRALVTAIRENSTVWRADPTYRMRRYFTDYTEEQLMISRRQVSTTPFADRIWGTLTDPASIKALTFTQTDYSQDSATETNLPATDPGAKTFGFQRDYPSLVTGETHILADTNEQYIWDKQEVAWRRSHIWFENSFSTPSKSNDQADSANYGRAFFAGDIWLNLNGEIFICAANVPAGAAVWYTPSGAFVNGVDPTPQDNRWDPNNWGRGFHAGVLWFNPATNSLWCLVSGEAGNAVWQAVTSGTPSVSILTTSNKDMVCLRTLNDGELATTTAMAATPLSGGYVMVTVNGLQVGVGDGAKNKECYFSADGGTTARAISAIVAGDQCYWMGSLAGYQLTTSHEMSWNYIVAA